MIKNPLKSTGLVSAWTGLSRVLGLVRDVVFARFFGAGAGMDVFVIAFQIPNFLRRLFAEGAFSQAFVPVLSESKEAGDPAATRDLINKVAGTLGGVLLLISAIIMLLSPAVIWLFASGFSADPEKFALATQLLRVTCWYLFFISLTAFAGGILNTFGRFGAPAFTPILLNLSLIGSVIFLSSRFTQPMMGLAWGVFVAGATQLAFQIPFLKQLNYFPRPRWGWHDARVQKILQLMLPAIFGASVAQINLIIDRKIASYLADGSISWLYYSDRLLEFPLGVFAIALATVVLPYLSARHNTNEPQLFSATLDWAQRLVVLITVPAAAGLFVLAGPLLSSVFQYDAFTAYDTRMAVYSLSAYAIGLIGFALVKVLVTGYFSRQDARTPVRIGVTAMVFNIVVNLALVVPMMKYHIVAPHAGLALATALAAWLNAGLLWRGLVKAGVYTPVPGWLKFTLRVLAATTLMTVFLYVFKGATSEWVVWEGKTRIVRLALLIPAAILIYFVSLLGSGIRPGDFRQPSQTGTS